MSTYADHIATLAPSADPAHVEAWMRLEHDTLDALTGGQFAAEVRAALGCIEISGLDESDKLAHSYGLRPRPREQPAGVGEHVLVARDGGLDPAVAIIRAESEHRPHLVKVQYVDSKAAAWIARTRIVGPAGDGRAGRAR